MTHYILNVEETASITGLPVTVLRFYAECGLIAPATGYTEEHICELRRVRRLMHDLELQQDAIEILLRMRQRILDLEEEVRHLQATVQAQQTQHTIETWVEAEWAQRT